MRTKILLGGSTLLMFWLSLMLTLYIKELKIRIADRNIRIGRLNSWIVKLNMTGLTNV